MKNSVEEFASEAIRFEQWACTTNEDAAMAARTALIRISALYFAALQLPPPFSEELDSRPDAERLPDEENERIIAYRSLPFDMYGQVSDPLPIPPGEPAIGSLADDIIDIYRDVVTGLRAYQNGDEPNAIWEWGFGFRHHWGEHATGAIRALHAWLAANDCEQLSDVL